MGAGMSQGPAESMPEHLGFGCPYRAGECAGQLDF